MNYIACLYAPCELTWKEHKSLENSVMCNYLFISEFSKRKKNY